MKHKLTILLFLLLYTTLVGAQVGINANNSAPDPSAMLDVKSNNKGILIPRMTTIQKNAILNKPDGLLVYDTDIKQFSYWKNFGTTTAGFWQDFGNLPTASTNFWNNNANNINNINIGNVGIGTTSPETKLHVEGTSIVANNTLIDPDLFPNRVIAGQIADGTGWESIGIGGKNGLPGQAWAIGSVNGDVSIAASNGTSDNSLQTGLILDTQRNVLLTPFGGNVGVGVNASKAKLEVTTPFTTTALFGSTATGISLQQNWPTIGFNQYRDNANVQRYIGNGFAMGNYIDPTTGTMAWNSMPSGTAGEPTPSEKSIMYLSTEGKLSLGFQGLANSTLLAKKITPNDDGAAVFSGTQYNSHFFYSNTEDTYIRGGKDGSAVIINDGALGNVGIGITDIPCKLTIYQPTIQSNSNTHVLQVRGQNPVQFFTDQFNTHRGYLKGVTNRSQTPHFAREGFEVGASGGDIYLTSAGSLPALTVNGTNNNVGIGAYPNTYKLEVNGTIRSKELIVETGWADYVFDKNYKLKTIYELEAYVNMNKHLPNIPSATEIENNGLKVGETNKAMMEKIEELALYIIQLKKEIDLLKTKN